MVTTPTGVQTPQKPSIPIKGGVSGQNGVKPYFLAKLGFQAKNVILSANNAKHVHI